MDDFYLKTGRFDRSTNPSNRQDLILREKRHMARAIREELKQIIDYIGNTNDSEVAVSKDIVRKIRELLIQDDCVQHLHNLPDIAQLALDDRKEHFMDEATNLKSTRKVIKMTKNDLHKVKNVWDMYCLERLTNEKCFPGIGLSLIHI